MAILHINDILNRVLNGAQTAIQVVVATGSSLVGKVQIRNAANTADIDPVAEGTFTGRLGEVQASPTANTVLGRLKDLLTGIVLAAGTNVIGKVSIDQTTPGTTNAIDLKTIAGGAPSATGKIDVKIAGGDDAVAGTTTGSAVTSDADGTLQQYLRGLVKMLADAWDDTNNLLRVGLQAGSAVIGKVDPATSAITIYTVTLTLANTEYSQALPANCRGFDMQPRTNVDVRWSNVTGKVAGSTEPFMTMKVGAGFSSPPLAQGASPSTIYLASATAGTIVEIVAYS